MSEQTRNPNKVQITPHPEWAQRFWDKLSGYKDQVVEHVYFQELGKGELSIERARRGLIDFYPLVENFPKYMALNLAKTNSGKEPGHREARTWIMQNMRVEQKHAEWWRDWAECINITQTELDTAEPSPLMDAINNFLWKVNIQGSLAEGIAATNLAVEWATGEWTVRILNGVESYAAQGLAKINNKTMSWLKAHADYDDKHPYEAMELIKMIAVREDDQKKAFAGAKRAMEYYTIALDDCYESYSPRVPAKAERNGAVHAQR